ncbi:4'-phosphopantetheinyl transferase family protein [Chitinimonas naiadis]
MLHLALASLAGLNREQAEVGALPLQDAESARLAQISRPARREQFLAGRWLARHLLHQALGGQAADWQISADAGVKPHIVGYPDLHLSLSHTGGWIACAIGDSPLGLDVERVQAQRDTLSMAELVCDAREYATLQALPESERAMHFVALWTRKEAWLKREGAPFDLSNLCHIGSEPAPASQADVASWCFAGQGLAVSLATRRWDELVTHWPGDWPTVATDWHRFHIR